MHEIPHREIGWVALSVVAVLLADLECGHIGHGQLLAAISTALEYRANQIFVFPGEAAEKDRHAATFFCRKRSLDWAVEVGRMVKSGNLPQAHAFCFQALLDF